MTVIFIEHGDGNDEHNGNEENERQHVGNEHNSPIYLPPYVASRVCADKFLLNTIYASVNINEKELRGIEDVSFMRKDVRKDNEQRGHSGSLTSHRLTTSAGSREVGVSHVNLKEYSQKKEDLQWQRRFFDDYQNFYKNDHISNVNGGVHESSSFSHSAIARLYLKSSTVHVDPRLVMLSKRLMLTLGAHPSLEWKTACYDIHAEHELMSSSKLLAFLKQQTFVAPSSIRIAAKLLLPHRLLLKQSGVVNGVDAINSIETIIDECLSELV